MSEKYDITISFDTTGSMYPALSEVRRNIDELVKRLFQEIPGIRIGLIAHGDYCDENKTYLMKSVDLTTDQEKLSTFVKNVGNTYGGDYPEAYEYVLHKSQNLSWDSDSMRALIMIGDAYPHEKDENPYKLDWREECKELKSIGVNIYSVQCLDYGNPKSKTFYKQMAELTNGYHLKLDQFSYIRDLILAICFRQVGDDELKKYEQEVKSRLGGMTRGMRKIFDTMLGRVTSESVDEENASVPDSDDDTIVACNPAKFQILSVDSPMSIKEFVENMGLTFKRGRGFYEFTKPEIISNKKEIILMEKSTGDLYEGTGAKKMAGLIDRDPKKKIRPSDINNYRVFIQSTSYNRKLIEDTGFLYEITDWGEE